MSSDLRTILFLTDDGAAGETAGMLIFDAANNGNIIRHAHEGGQYNKAFLVGTSELGPLAGFTEIQVDDPFGNNGGSINASEAVFRAMQMIFDQEGPL